MSDACAFVWADGELVPADRPVVRADDPGFLLGRAAFETLLWETRVLYFVEEHLARLATSGAGLALPTPRWAPRAALRAFCAALGDEPTAVRVTWTPGAPGRGASLIVTGRRTVAPDPRGVGVLLVPRAKLAGDPLETWKTSSRLRNALAGRARRRELGAWEALLGTDAGDVLEGTVTNLFAVLDGRLVTPPTARGALAGTVRAQLVAKAPARACRRSSRRR
ncbi:MAG: aminotransferase class IV [Planctomycetes bacterium]|nr:aminotransferase class IV [Planctomycetota bacterium]